MFLPPLVVVVLVFLAGLLPALRFAPPALPLWLSTAAILLACWRQTPRPSGGKDLHELLLVAAFAGAGASLGALRAASSDCRLSLPDQAKVEVEGVLGAGIFPGEAADGPPLLPLEHAVIRRGEQRCRAPVRTLLPWGAPAALAGSRVVFEGTWVRSRRLDNGGPWPVDGFRAGYLRSVDSLRIEPPAFSRHPLLTLRGRTEAHLHDIFPRHFGMVEALLLGRRERLDPEVRNRFARAGLSHLLAISGSHVAVFAAVLLVLGSALRMPRRRITWSTIGLTSVYLAVIGAPASAARAGVMVTLALLSVLLQRPAAVLPIAAGTTLLLLAIDPLAVLDVGLQLSFAGVFGIIAGQRIFGRRVARMTRGTPWKWIADTTLVSVAAFLATAPITAYHFGTVAPIAILSNLPAIPLTSLALIGVLAAAVAAPVRPLADLLASGAGLSLDLLDRVATVAANAPYANATVDRADLFAWGLATVAAGTTLVLVRRGSGLVRATVATGVAATAIIVWPIAVNASSRGLEIHFIDVGQGDAIAVRTPRGRWLLVDAGPRGREYDAGERRVVPFFRARGVGRLSALILTHPDLDHIGGAPAVLRALEVERIIEPGLAVGKELYLELLQEVQSEGAEWLAARDGRVLRLDGIELRFLWPDRVLLAGEVETNEASAVALLRYGEFSLLLPGDASSDVERELIRRYGAHLDADVLKAGHHGSATSTSASFLQAVDPELVVISVGRGNRYGHPAPAVLARLRSTGVDVARTDEEGTISLRVRDENQDRPERIGE
ncbi:MAG TPA: DNA internalization-related competence protein ComEC/Rec2 [Longimicrobiaceae bacterium]